MSVMHVVSVSTGKDSAATAILALETIPRDQLRFISCDTGNEHENYLPYLAYMERHLGIKIDVLRTNFDRELAGKAEYVRNVYPTKLIKEGFSAAETAEIIERCLRALAAAGSAAHRAAGGGSAKSQVSYRSGSSIGRVHSTSAARSLTS